METNENHEENQNGQKMYDDLKENAPDINTKQDNGKYNGNGNKTEDSSTEPKIPTSVEDMYKELIKRM